MDDRDVMVAVSKDFGHTWGSWREKSLGQLGQYPRRVRMRRFGESPQFCLRIRVTSPVVMKHMGAVADMDVGE